MQDLDSDDDDLYPSRRAEKIIESMCAPLVERRQRAIIQEWAAGIPA